MSYALLDFFDVAIIASYLGFYISEGQWLLSGREKVEILLLLLLLYF